MRKYLLDTGIAGAFINNRLDIRSRVQGALSRGDRVGIGIPVLGELFAGAELSQSPLKNSERLLRGLSSLTIWPFDLAAARQFGRLFAVLRKAGRPMQQVDIQIAAIALAMRNCTVVTMDGDFKSIPGLKIANWTE